MNSNTKSPFALSFDIEDWFTVRNMRGHIPEQSWDQQDYRVSIGVDYILAELDRHQINATFFILGWVAERSPELVREIHRRGHEIASHGYSHKPIDLMTPEEFRSDLARSLDILSELTGEKIKGFRAPSFSVTEKTAWSLEIMQELGLEYDSSIFVTTHPDYGVSTFPERLARIDRLVEVPIVSGRLFGRRLPANGGGYFRLLPYQLTKKALENHPGPAVLYFHPWEFDHDQPRVALSPLKKFRHYVGLKQNRTKFARLLQDFRFCAIRDQLALTDLETLPTFKFAGQVNLRRPLSYS